MREATRMVLVTSPGRLQMTISRRNWWRARRQKGRTTTLFEAKATTGDGGHFGKGKNTGRR